MCGIVGCITSDMRYTRDFNKALKTLDKRGPDAQGSIAYRIGERQLLLGATRLAIIDLHHSANQPMEDITGQYVIVFNGEIYNYQLLKNLLEKKGHQFKTKSDTEVILEGFKAYGINIVEKIEGMFAFVIYDKKNNNLTFARDHFGKKPFYYYLENDNFLFGSELKTILAFSNLAGKITLNHEAVKKYLMYGYVPSPQSIFNKIQKLPPATVIQLNIVTMQIVKKMHFWKLDKINLADISFSSAVNKVDTLLHESVQKRLISDVPVGTFLSGGIDSSLITTIASRLHPGIETFSVVYDDKRYDESKFIKLVGKSLEISNNYFHFKDNDASELLSEVLEYMDEPIADASLLPTTYIAKQTRKTVTVALSGDGGDELFGGYSKYTAQLMVNNPLLGGLIKSGKHFYKYFDKLPITPEKKGILRKLLEAANDDIYVRHFIWGSGSFTLQELQQLMPGTHILPIEIFQESREYAELFNQQDFGNLLLYLDSRIQLPDWYLVKVDRASMSQSLEVRSPLLDKKLSEFAFSLPSKYKFSMRGNKIILKEVAKKYLPREIIERQKMGFGLPLNRWLTTRFRRDVELSLKSLDNEMFNSDYITKLWKELCAGKEDHGTKIWRLFILGVFLKKYEKYL